MLEIPVFPKISSDFSISILLEQVRCNFRIIWNSKIDYWMINTYEEPENDLVLHGLKIIPNYPFLHTYGPSFPGEIICLKKGGDTEEEITYTNFGIGWFLIYLTEEEFNEWDKLTGFNGVN